MAGQDGTRSGGGDDGSAGREPTVFLYPETGRQVTQWDYPGRPERVEVDPNAAQRAAETRIRQAQERASGTGRTGDDPTDRGPTVVVYPGSGKQFATRDYPGRPNNVTVDPTAVGRAAKFRAEKFRAKTGEGRRGTDTQRGQRGRGLR